MTIAIRSLTALPGPNAWYPGPVTLSLVRLDPDGADLGTLTRELVTICAGLDDPASPVAPLEPLPFSPADGPADLLARLAVNLQRRVGFDLEFAAARPAPDGDGYEVVAAHADAVIGAAAMRLAVRLLDAHLDARGPAIDLDLEFAAQFGLLVRSRRLGTAAQTIVDAARRRGIPVARMDPVGRVIELGNGAFRQLVRESMTPRTSAVTQHVCADKELTRHYLIRAGLPVPASRVARTPEQALAAAEALGYPVVLKPADSGGSGGVAAGLLDADDVRAWFESALRCSPSRRVLVERQVPGRDYRVIVIDGRVDSVNWFQRAFVTGDGVSTVRALIDRENADPRRGPRPSCILSIIRVDEDTERVLRAQGLDLDAVPAAGREVLLHSTGKKAQGGIAIDATDEAHPDNVAICELAARTVGADVVAIDVVAPDITRSIWETGGAVLELNIGSGYTAQLSPALGRPRDPGPAIVEMLFPPGAPVRVPLVAVLGEAEAGADAAAAIARVLGAGGATVGVASARGVAIGGRTWRDADARDLAGAELVLASPATEAAVLQADPERVLAEGLGFGYADVVVLLGRSGLLAPSGHPVEAVVTDLLAEAGTLVVALAVGDDLAPALDLAPPDPARVIVCARAAVPDHVAAAMSNEQ